MTEKQMLEAINKDERVRDAYPSDDGGLWIDLNSGYYNPWMECAIINCETIEEAFDELQDVVKKVE